MKRPCRHIRTSVKGKRFLVNPDVPAKVQKEIISNHLLELQKELKKEGRVKLNGLGIFKLKKVAGKPKGSKYRDIKTGEMVARKESKPGSKKIKFFPSKKFKEVI